MKKVFNSYSFLITLGLALSSILNTSCGSKPEKENSETTPNVIMFMMAFLNDVGARIPKANPDYDPEVYKKLKNYKKTHRVGRY